MKKILIHFFSATVALTGLLSLNACKQGATLPTSTGTANEILVVMSDSLMKTAVKDSMLSVLNRDVVCLPQSEPYFTISRTDPSDFTNLLKPTRNILKIDAGYAYTEVKFKVSEDRWAKPQAILTIQGPSVEAVAQALGQYREDIINYFVKAERKRAIAHHKHYMEEEKVKMVRDQFGIDMVIPRGMTRSKVADNFLWISNNSAEYRQNIIIYTYPYTRQDAFQRENLLAKRDSVLQKQIPGPAQGSYMTTEYRFDPPVWKETALENGQYATEIRGLWRVEGEIMGGPFVSISCLDEANQRVVTAEGFIYAPNLNKRNVLRQLEAVLYTIQFMPQAEDVIIGTDIAEK